MADPQTTPTNPVTGSQPPVISPAPVKTPPNREPQHLAPHRVKPKLGKNVLGCVASAAVVALVGISILALLTAKTGVVKLPLFSRFYTGPIPTRLVNAKSITVNQFRVLLSYQLFNQGLTKKNPPYTIKLTEKDVSGALETAIDTALRDQKWKQIFTQLVIRPTDFEMLSQYEYGWVRLDVLIRFKPVMESGGVRFEPVYAQVGDYPIPPSVAYTVLGYLFSRDLGTWSIKFGDMVLTSVRLYDGYLEAVVSSPAPTAAPEPLK